MHNHLQNIDVWLGLFNLQCSSLTSSSLKYRNRTFLISWLGFRQGCIVLQYIGFISKHSITWNHKGRDVTALVQASLEIFLLLFTLIGKQDECWMVHQVFNKHLQNAIILMYLMILISRSPRFPVDISSVLSTSSLCELWRLGLEDQTWFRHGVRWLILLSCAQGHDLWRI